MRRNFKIGFESCEVRKFAAPESEEIQNHQNLGLVRCSDSNFRLGCLRWRGKSDDKANLRITGVRRGL